MANFGQLVLTNVGIQEQYKAQIGGQLKFKRIAMGSGKYSGNITALTKLVAENVSVDVTKGYTKDNSYMVEGFFSNESLNTGFAWREIGLFVEDAEGKEVLYCYANAGDTYDYIPATTDERYSKYIRIATAIGNASNVSIVENGSFVYVDTVTFNTAVEELQTDINQLWPSKSSKGNLIAIKDSANQPFAGMNIYGKSIQNGTPTPDAPIDIVSVENPSVTVCGKNIMKPSGTKSQNGVSLTMDNDGVYTISGTSTASINLNLGMAFIKGGYKYKPTVVVYSGSINPSYWSFEAQANMHKDSKGELSSDVDTEMSAFIYASAAGATYNAKFAIMLEPVTDGELGIYEPYKEEKTLTVETPNGMPGIPVSSGGNYTDKNGQQWVCDEIDLERGVYIQRCYTYIAETISNLGTTANNRASVNLPFNGLPYNIESALCSHFEYKPTVYSDSGNDVGFVVSNKTLFFRFGSSSEINTMALAQEWIDNQISNETPLTVHYILEKPIETALTSEQIATYKAMKSYNPNTTIFNDSGADMNVQYVTKTYDDVLTNVIFEMLHSTIYNYQKPWAVDGLIGKIGKSGETHKFISYATGVAKETSIRINSIINSGDVILEFVVNFDSNQGSGSTMYDGTHQVVIYVNDKEIATHNFTHVKSKATADDVITTPLNVVKGDTVTIKVIGTTDKMTDTTNYNEISISELSLLANLDTPYNYLDLFDAIEEV